jgi:tRNA pseudouridine55 synthase
VEITTFEITEIDGINLKFKVACSKGTYIRSLAHDFGKALNSGAHLSELRRTRIGSFSVEKAISPEAFLNQLS